MCPGTTIHSPALTIQHTTIQQIERLATVARLPQSMPRKNSLAATRQCPTQTDNTLDYARAYHSTLGAVVITSGLGRKSHNGSHALDFALVSVNDTRRPLPSTNVSRMRRPLTRRKLTSNKHQGPFPVGP